MSKNIYIVISQTTTKYARLLRKIGGMEYNHASIALDARLEQLYGCARRQLHLPLDAGIVPEFPARFTLNKPEDIPIRIYRISVSDIQYDTISKRIHDAVEDRGNIYNFYSVLLWPLLHGFSTDKAYTCSEFAAEILEMTDVMTRKPACKYSPQQLTELLDDYEIYRGGLIAYTGPREQDTNFFDPVSAHRFLRTCAVALSILLVRDIKKLIKLAAMSAFF